MWIIYSFVLVSESEHVCGLQPFYGGKRDQISAEIFGPDKKSFCSIKGEWNGIMWARQAQAVCTGISIIK